MTHLVSKIAIMYSILWLFSLWVQNTIFSTVISGFGVFILVVVAIGVDNVFGENDDSESKLKIELEKVKNEIAELKNNRKPKVQE